MYAGPMRCTMSRFLRAQFDLMAYQKKLGFDAAKTRKHPNGHFVQLNSVRQLKNMPGNGAKCTAQYIAVAVEAIAAVRSGPDQSTLNQTWVIFCDCECCAVKHVCPFRTVLSHCISLSLWSAAVSLPFSLSLSLLVSRVAYTLSV